MREERDDLKEAAEQTLNVIIDLDLSGRINWVSPSWKQVVGTAPESVEGRLVSEILLDNQNVFYDAIEFMKEDDSRSRFISFALRMGPDSLLLKRSSELQSSASNTEKTAEVVEDGADQQSQSVEDQDRDILKMEAQGIMVFDQVADLESHVSVKFVA